MRLVFCLVAALGAGGAHAAVYKCTGASGAVEFRDKPCAPGNGGEITVKGVARSDESAASAAEGSKDADNTASGKASGGDSAQLTGAWCEYAVSAEADGDKDESMPAQWTLTGDTLEYRARHGVIRSRIIRDGSSFELDNGMLGGIGRSWDIVARRGDTLVLHGPVGGYFHLRRGTCR